MQMLLLKLLIKRLHFTENRSDFKITKVVKYIYKVKSVNTEVTLKA